MGLPKIYNLLIGIIAVAVAIFGQMRLADAHFFDAALLYGVALLLIFWAVGRQELPHDAVKAENKQQPVSLAWMGRNWWRFLPILLGVGCGAWALWLFNQDLERPGNSAWWLYLLSALWMLLAAALLDRGKPHAKDAGTPLDSPKAALQKSARWSRADVGWLLLIMLVAAFMRLYRFGEWPFGTWYDEAAAGLLAQRMIEDRSWRPIFPGSINITFHYTILLAWAMQLLGETTSAIRAVSVIMGLGTVLAAYLAGREFFGRTIGLTLAALFAVARWSVNFSRIGMYNIATPLFELLTIGFLLRGLRRNRYLDFTLAGLAIGLGLCFYPAFQLFVIVVALFLLYSIVVERGFFWHHWSGLILMTVTAALVFAPLALFAYQESDTYLARTQETSLFADKTAEQRIPALVENTRKHLLMFNVKGDPNGRHNLPGEPMLDPYSGALLLLGLALSLRWIWRPRWLLLPLWLAITLLGGILSLDFEAPQSLRTIGAQPAVYLLAMVPLYLLWREWQKSIGRYFGSLIVWPLLLLFLPLGWSNFNTYFLRQAYDFAAWNAFSTPETIAARILSDLDGADAYVTSFFHGHPTINFLARNRSFRRLETTDRLPLAWDPEKDAVLILNAESSALYDEARRFYPNAFFEEIKPPFGGPTIVYHVRLTPDDIRSIQGLVGRYFATDDWTGEPIQIRQDRQLAFDWRANPPLLPPFSVEWTGVLNAPLYGEYQFFVQAQEAFELYIGEELLFASDEDAAGAILLAKGNHTIRLRAVGASGPFSLSWRPPDRSAELVPPSALYVPPVTGNGLLGSYYPNGDWAEPAAYTQIDARFGIYYHVTPLPRPYTVEWRGKIAIPVAGTYFFGLESIDESMLFIDDQELLRVNERNLYREQSVELSAGLHDIRLRFADRTDHTHINFYWSPPGSGRQLVPADVLFPPQGNYERVTIPALEQLIFSEEQPASPTIVMPQLDASVEMVYDGLQEPKGIAIGDNGMVYVADTGNRRLLLMTMSGEVVKEITGFLVDGDESISFVEPFDLALDAEGRLYLLDSKLSRLFVFDPEGEALSEVQADPIFFDRARGIHIDRENRIWLASTAIGRVTALNLDGERLVDIPVWPGEDAQPVDVVVGAGGDIFVADAGLNKLIRFDPSGRRVQAWEIAEANSLNGSHLTIDQEGFLYLTEPEQTRLVKLSPAGERLGEVPLESPDGRRTKPIGVAVDSLGRIWFVDNDGGTAGFVESVEE